MLFRCSASIMPPSIPMAEGVVNLVGGELLTPGHQRVPEHFGVNLSVDFEGFK